MEARLHGGEIAYLLIAKEGNDVRENFVSDGLFR
jgi:hypothetical protein